MDITTARHALKQFFGYDHFRPMQADIISALYAGQDALVLMPTGGGKSVCFQIPAVTLPGTAVVVSPLIALMKDQVEGLRAAGVRAAFLNSSLDSKSQLAVEDAFFTGELKLLYVSPEKIVSGNFIPLLQRAQISLFAVDEAHCISAWGHDFRPEYTQLSFLKKLFPHIPIVALTATADRLTRQDITRQLELNNPATFISSFDRPNIQLEVRPGQGRREQIIQFLKRHPRQSGIIYCLSRKSTEELSAKLREAGFTAAAYHAALPDAERARVQEAFINDNIPIICATIAFGMGIDKSNVRWVIHYNLPKNIEGYYQEIGRAGRDGTAAQAILFHSYQDVMTLTEIITENGGANAEVQLGKLERMRQYAEALSCRRRILLNYFNENLTENCGNCDICKNPPQSFDGTVVAQKALSAVYRLREGVGMNMLIDVLRGSVRREITERGYDKIKTYGQGRDFSQHEWQNYLLQLIDLGFLQVAAERQGVLQLTPASERVLFGGEKVQLVRLATLRERQQTEREKAKVAAPRERVRDDLFERLRQLRRQLALSQGVPPYIIFSDATLEEMAAQRPQSLEELRYISGVGEKKLGQYGEAFLDVIVGASPPTGRPEAAGESVYALFQQQGLSAATIAREKEMPLNRVYTQLTVALQSGRPLDVGRLMPLDTIEKVRLATRYLQRDFSVEDVYEYFDGQIEKYQLQLAMAYLQRKTGDHG